MASAGRTLVLVCSVVLWGCTEAGSPDTSVRAASAPVSANQEDVPHDPLQKGGAVSDAVALVASVEIVVSGVNDAGGKLRAVLCRAEESFPDDCARRANVAAERGAVGFTFAQVPVGTYAFAAFHDANDDGILNAPPGGLPREGIAFSNNVMGRRGPPSFEQSAFLVAKPVRQLARMSYLSR